MRLALALLALPFAAGAAPICPQAALVAVAGHGEGVVEASQMDASRGKVCQVRLADGRLVAAPPADLVPVAAGDTPPENSLPLGLLRCETLALALAPGLYILEDGQAGSLTQLGAEVQFDSGPLQGLPARIEAGQLILTPPGAAKAATCRPYEAS